VAAYSSEKIAKLVAQARNGGWKELGLSGCNVQDNDLRTLMAEPAVEQLQLLVLASNQLSTLPPEIGRLTALTGLFLNNNQLTTLPPEIGRLTALTGLGLSDNQLSTLPPEIGGLTALTTLTLSGNQLSTLPPEIGQLTALTRLRLDGNQLSTLPPEIGRLTALTALRLSNNQLSTLPPEIGRLTALTALDVNGNPLTDALLEAANQGTHAVVAYLRGLEQKQRMFEAKLLLVGEGKVGKTSLLAALRGEEFVQDRPTTHGIDVKPVNLPHPRDEAEIQLNAWDFGGQEVYRITHQFFFSRHALYLVLWNARLGAQQCDLESWLRRIKLRVGNDAKIIVVATYFSTDLRLSRIDEHDLERKFHPCIAGFCEVDSQSQYGIEKLKKLIAETAAGLPQMGEDYPATWKAAQDELLTLAVDHDDHPGRTHVPFSDFAAICRKHKVEEQAQTVLATILDRRGRIMYYGDEERLADVIILRPDWLTRAISYVLEDPQTNVDRGVLQHERLQAIWHDHGDPDKEQYKPPLYPLFVRLMERFDVCYRMEDDQADLVAQLVNVKRPDGIPWSADDGTPPGITRLKLVCRMDEDPPGLVPWMIVRTHRYNRRHLHWQKGIFLEHGQHGTALIEFFDRELTIQVRAEYPAHLTSILWGALEALIDDRWPGLKGKYKMTVPCPGHDEQGKACRERFPILMLQKRRADDKLTVNCNECGTDHQIDALLTGLGRPRIEETLDRIHADLQKLLERRSVTSAELAEVFGQLRRFMLDEKRACPGLFSLLPENLAKWNPKNWMKEAYRLTLWCEHPDEPHPCCPIGSGGQGEYVIKQANEHLKAIAPYAAVVARLLTTAASLAAPGAGMMLQPAIVGAIRPHLDMMNSVAKAMLTGNIDAPTRIVTYVGTNIGPKKDIINLRALEALLSQLDPAKNWGGLRPAPTESNEILWLCPEHYREYVPDLPVIAG